MSDVYIVVVLHALLLAAVTCLIRWWSRRLSGQSNGPLNQRSCDRFLKPVVPSPEIQLREHVPDSGIQPRLLGRSSSFPSVGLDDIYQVTLRKDSECIGVAEYSQQCVQLKNFLGCKDIIVADEVHILKTSITEHLHNLKQAAERYVKEVDYKMFVPTRAATAAKEKLADLGVVIIKGPPGSGKTTLGLHLLKQIKQQESRWCLVITHPNQWESIPQPKDFNNIKQNERFVVMIDDMFGKSSLSKHLQTLWEQKLELMWPLVETGQIKVILIFRSQIFAQSEKNICQYKLFKSINHLDLHGKIYQLCPEEKRNILKKYLSLKKIRMEEYEIDNIVHDTQSKLGFPQCCNYFVSNLHVQKRGADFFHKPVEYINESIQILKKENKAGYLVLLLVMAKKGRLHMQDLNFFHMSPETTQLIVVLEKVCATGPVSFSDEICSLKGTYLHSENGFVSFSHQSIFDSVFLQFCLEYQREAIDICPADMLVEYVSTQESGGLGTVVSGQNLHYLHMRILQEMQTGDFKTILDHPVLSDAEFIKFCDTRTESLISILRVDSHKTLVTSKLLFNKSNTFNHKDLSDVSWFLNENRVQTIILCEADFSLCDIILKNIIPFAQMFVPLLDFCFESDECHQKKTIALVCACYIGSSELASLLLEAKATPTINCIKAICVAATDNVHLFKLLMEHPLMATVNSDTLDDLLCLSLQHGNTNIAKTIISEITKTGGNSQILDFALTQLIVQMSENFRNSCRHYFHVNLPQFNAHQHDLFTFVRDSGGICFPNQNIHIAATHKSADIVEELVNMGGQVTMTDHEGKVPLHYAALCGVTKTVSYLLTVGSSVNAVDNSGSTVLHQAAIGGSVDMVRHLVEKGSNVNAVDNEGITVLHEAAGYGSVDMVRFLVDKGSSVSAVDNDERSVLHKAAIWGSLDMVRYFVDIGLNIDAVDNKGRTVLHEAANQGSVDMVRYLVDKGSNVDAVDNDRKTVLHEAAIWGSVDMVRFLVDRGLKVNAVDDKRRTVLHEAVSRGSVDTVRYLVDKGSNVNAVDNDRKTVLHEAARWGSVALARYLVDQGANVDAVDNEGKTLLHEAPIWGSVEMVRYLVDKGLDVNAVDNKGRTVLHEAARRGSVDMIRYLVDKGSNVDAVDNDGRTVLHKVVKWGSCDMVRYLVDKGSRVDVVDKCERTVLHEAAEWGSVDLVRYLVDIGLNIDAVDDERKTALHEAVNRGSVDIVRYLVEEGSNVSAIDNDGKTVLHKAAKWGSADMVRYLVDKGSSVNTVDNDGRTVLHETAESGSVDMVKYLVDKGSSVNSVDNDCRTILHEAVESGSVDMVRYLVDKGSDVNAVDKGGRTAVHVAACRNSMDKVRYLLDKGSNVDAVGNDGRTALHEAAESASVDMVTLLVDKGSNVNAVSNNRRTVLHHAVAGEAVDIVQYLVDKGSNVNAVDIDGNTPLHIAFGQGNSDVLKVLVRYGSILSIRNNDGFAVGDHMGEIGEPNSLLFSEFCLTQSDQAYDSENKMRCKQLIYETLYKAVLIGKTESVDSLLQERSVTSLSECKVSKLFHLSALFGHAPILTLFHKAGVHPAVRNLEGGTALHAAAFWGWVETVRLLLDLGVDPDAVDHDGCSAIFGAVTMGHVKVVKLLIMQNASLHILNKKNQTPHDVACERISDCKLEDLRICYSKIRDMTFEP